MPKIPKKVTPKKVTPKDEEEKILPPEEETDLDSEEESENEEGEEEGEEEEKPPKLESKTSKEKEEVIEEEEDYLQAYQYKKVNDKPMVGGPLTNPDPGSKAEAMKKFLLSCPVVETLVPLPEGTDPRVPYSVTRNGYRLDLPTNTYLKLPRPIVDMIVDSNNFTNIAIKQFQGKIEDSALL